ncbi:MULTISPECIES: hypothetical protein [Citrobacter freundii complex]|uniref:Uncharacterized protein n=1 Tax=Citrobacter portucalensis TaxID=1639133 RepID=A0AAJ1JQX7_9ENTR|nr:hypothetical protein [Citrobacter portucalensis]MDE9625392.1 hypothetical protein [Citrobacter portucalensis]HAT2302213.1 hypothetical protein [Citrobacter freundii]
MSEQTIATEVQEDSNEKSEQKSKADFLTEFDELINAKGNITPELLTAANRYFLYFSFFESLLLDCNGGQGQSSAYAEKLLEMNVVDLDVLNTTYRFFSKRYLSNQDRYESLCGEPKHTSQSAREKYIATMQEESTDPLPQLDLCLFVCFRLRNNLFHGPKWRYFLKGQEELLLEAGNLIHSILISAKKSDDWTFVNILKAAD